MDDGPAEAKDLLGELQTDTAATLENLRDLARGIYPPLLADLGLVAAFNAQASKSPVPVTVEADGIGRSTPLGSGQRNMADRLAALGGRLEVRSAPSQGTTVTAHLPVPAAN